MRLRLSFLVVALGLLSLCTEARAQTPVPSSCPTITIKCPTDIVDMGTPMTVSVEVTGGDPSLDLKYHWQVSAGKISSGEGTPAITIDTTGTVGEIVKATVEVDGLPAGCDRVESCTQTIFSCGMPRLFDMYEGISPSREDERLTNFGTQLRQESGAQGYIFYFGPRDTDKRLSRAREFLTSQFGIDPGRIMGVSAGHRKKFAAQLWIRAVGAAEPRPVPFY